VFPIKTTTVSCTAMDIAGNSAAGGFTVTVRGAAAQLTDLKARVNGLSGVSSGLKNSLVTKLAAAQDLLSKGNITGACGKMNDFIQEVQAKSGKGLTAAQANQLATAALRIKTVIGCR
jgi:hypothetical protein